MDDIALLSTDAVLEQRLELLVAKHTRGLSGREVVRLERLTEEVHRRIPRVTDADWQRLREMTREP
jgi:hypothetical protein